MENAKAKNKEGFSLIEAVVSIAVLAILLMGFTMMISTAARMNSAAALRQQQFSDAKSDIETGQNVTESDDVISIAYGSGASAQINITRHRVIKDDLAISSFEVRP